MSKIKLGIIGAGLAWERLHYPAIKRLSDKFEITAVCDIDLDRAQKLANEYNLPNTSIYSDYQSMLTKADVDAIDLMVPINSNFEVAKAVITSGKHLLAEKPFASSVEEAKELISLSEKSNSKILVAENTRYTEENVLIKNLINENKIGDVIYFIDNHVSEFQKEMSEDTFASTEWRQHPLFKGGILLDSGIHHIASQRFLFGNIVNTYASGKPVSADFSHYSCINALLTYKGHISGHYSFYTMGKETQTPLVGFRIFGTKGEIYLEDKDCGFVNISYKDGNHEAIPYTPNEGYYYELNNFYDAIQNNTEIVSTPQKELGDIQAIFDILDSIEKREIIKSTNAYFRAVKH